METAVLTPAEIRDLASLLYAALRPAAPPSASRVPRKDRLRALVRRAQATGRARVVSLAVPRRRAG